MLRKLSVMFAFVFMAFGLVASPAMAAVTFDAATGAGFVGKGDVQLALGWNNKQLQDRAESLEFTYESTVVTEVIWICTNSNNQHTQERERTTTTMISGVVEDVAHERNQITGFNLNGFESSNPGTPTTEGNPLNSCPNGPWTLTTQAGAPEVVSSTGGLYVNGVLLGN